MPCAIALSISCGTRHSSSDQVMIRCGKVASSGSDSRTLHYLFETRESGQGGYRYMYVILQVYSKIEKVYRFYFLYVYAVCFFTYIQPVVFDLHWDHSPFKADSYGNPIASIRFWSGCRNKYISHESKNRLLCEIGCGDRAWDRARVVCLFARGFQELLSSSQRRLHRYA